jgi:hypothetical protein
MDTASSQAPKRAPICAFIATLLQLFAVSLAWLTYAHETAPTDGRQFGAIFMSFPLLDAIPFAAVGFAVASLLRRERFRWLGWLVLFSYGFPILYALIIALSTTTRQ